MVTDSEGQANRKPLERQSKEGVLAALSEWARREVEIGAQQECSRKGGIGKEVF